LRIKGSKNNKTFEGSWNLTYEDEGFVLPLNLDYLEGEDITIPYPHDLFNSGSVSLLKVSHNRSVIKNCFDSIEYHRKEGHEYGDIVLKDLEYGKQSFSNCFRYL
jgi:hypothetical protein